MQNTTTTPAQSFRTSYPGSVGVLRVIFGLLIFGAFGATALSLFASILQRGAFFRSMTDPWSLLLIFVLVAGTAAGLWLARWGLNAHRRSQVERREAPSSGPAGLKPLDAEMTLDGPAFLGETLTGSFRFSGAIEAKAITLTLSCYQWKHRYQPGDTAYEGSPLFRNEIAIDLAELVVVDGVTTIPFSIELPKQGLLARPSANGTFFLGERTRWKLKIRADRPGFDFVRSFPLEVGPARSEQARDPYSLDAGVDGAHTGVKAVALGDFSTWQIERTSSDRVEIRSRMTGASRITYRVAALVGGLLFLGVALVPVAITAAPILTGKTVGLVWLGASLGGVLCAVLVALGMTRFYRGIVPGRFGMGRTVVTPAELAMYKGDRRLITIRREQLTTVAMSETPGMMASHPNLSLAAEYDRAGRKRYLLLTWPTRDRRAVKEALLAVREVLSIDPESRLLIGERAIHGEMMRRQARYLLPVLPLLIVLPILGAVAGWLIDSFF